MRVNVSGKNIELTPALRKHVEDRVKHACDHLMAPPASCQSHLSKEGKQFKAEISLNYKGRNFAAGGTHGADLYQAIDAAGSKLRRQLDDCNHKANNHR